MAAVSLKGIRKTYPNGLEVVKGIDLEIENGKLCVLVGPSGCGKSTLLRMIAGLESVTAGHIEIAGKDVAALEPAERDIAMVFQNYALYPHMSVFDNIAYGLRNRGTPRNEIKARVEEAEKLLALDGLLQRRPRELSGGQRQRVAMGRAIVRRPSAFLFDEPLSNLDAKLRTQMRVEIRTLQQRLGVTSVYVTHDQLEAMTMADQLVVMNAGQIEQVGTPAQVYDAPVSQFVAGFLGSPAMNFLPGTIQAAGDLVLDAGGHVTLTGTATQMQGQRVIAGVRPEAIGIAQGAPAFTARLELVEELGSARLLHLRLGQTTLVAVVGRETAFATGQDLPVSIPAASVHLFNEKTGRALV
ncbi:MAG: sn-glycerol-3-phosphate ABC transporter ATP-binding protein UgpC [Hyphomicrobiales bacterium]|nr:sn-glycerol-3-phosphate ABC transporter ATP-binding protein UgpC [Hyphomicrobiales bacterium]MDE2114637.1 sn-glycerol-3-phosphate ABC transporter ATP-binding protein UgpC [Hyphomicrobiales bacterium]